MRKLSMKQKKYILTIVQQEGPKFQLTVSQKQTLEKMNDYETLYQDAERFLQDVVFSRATGNLMMLEEKWLREWQ